MNNDKIAELIINTLAVLVAAYLLNGVVVSSFVTALVVAILLALVNTFIKPIFVVATIPITILTFGIFFIFVDTFMILLVDLFVSGFHVASFFTAFLFSLILWFTNSLLLKMFR